MTAAFKSRNLARQFMENALRSKSSARLRGKTRSRVSVMALLQSKTVPPISKINVRISLMDILVRPIVRFREKSWAQGSIGASFGAMRRTNRLQLVAAQWRQPYWSIAGELRRNGIAAVVRRFLLGVLAHHDWVVRLGPKPIIHAPGSTSRGSPTIPSIA